MRCLACHSTNVTVVEEGAGKTPALLHCEDCDRRFYDEGQQEERPEPDELDAEAAAAQQDPENHEPNENQEGGE